MKKSIFTLATILFMSGAFITSCKSPTEKVEDSKENMDEAKQDYAAEYEKFKSESNDKISANEKLIIDLKAYSKTKKKEVQSEYEKTIADLEAKNEKMKAKMTDYKEEGNDKWNSFKEEFNHDMNEIGESLKDLNKDNVK